jgi:anti-anti-sigma regulatory factor
VAARLPERSAITGGTSFAGWRAHAPVIAHHEQSVVPQRERVTPDIVVAAAILTALCIAACWPAPSARRRTSDCAFHFTAVDAWALEHFCASFSRIRSSIPELTGVRIDMRFLPALDASTLAALESLLAELRAIGIGLLLHDCTDGVAEELELRGFSIGRSDRAGRAVRTAGGSVLTMFAASVTPMRRRGGAQREVLGASRAQRRRSG